jgi:hypothetical protein
MYSVEYRKISEPTPVMISIIITLSTSTWMARSTRRSPIVIQFQRLETSVRTGSADESSGE